MDGDRTTATRKQQLSTIIEKLPENLRKAYERTPVDGLTDEQFNTLVGEITTEVDGIVNDTRAKGLFSEDLPHRTAVHQVKGTN